MATASPYSSSPYRDFLAFIIALLLLALCAALPVQMLDATQTFDLVPESEVRVDLGLPSAAPHSPQHVAYTLIRPHHSTRTTP